MAALKPDPLKADAANATSSSPVAQATPKPARYEIGSSTSARPVTLSIGQLAVAPGSFTARATMRIDRTEFGITAYRGLARSGA